MKYIVSILMMFFVVSCSLKKDIQKREIKIENTSKNDSISHQSNEDNITILKTSKELFNDSGRVTSKETKELIKGAKKSLNTSLVNKESITKTDSTSLDKKVTNEVVYKVDKSIIWSGIILLLIFTVIVLRKPLSAIKF